MACNRMRTESLPKLPRPWNPIEGGHLGCGGIRRRYASCRNGREPSYKARRHETNETGEIVHPEYSVGGYLAWKGLRKGGDH
jgi:hypothetical protein